MMDSVGIWAVTELPKELIWYIDKWLFLQGMNPSYEWCFIRISNNCLEWWGVHLLGKCTGGCTGGCTGVGLPLSIMPCHWVRRLVCGNCLGSPRLQAYLFGLYFVLVCCLLLFTLHNAHLHIWLLTLVITSMNKPKFVHPFMKGFVIILRKYLRSMNQK